MKKMASSGSLIAAVLEGKEFAAKLPGRVIASSTRSPPAS